MSEHVVAGRKGGTVGEPEEHGIGEGARTAGQVANNGW